MYTGPGGAARPPLLESNWKYSNLQGAIDSQKGPILFPVDYTIMN